LTPLDEVSPKLPLLENMKVWNALPCCTLMHTSTLSHLC
jgi:hypothetical protein